MEGIDGHLQTMMKMKKRSNQLIKYCYYLFYIFGNDIRLSAFGR